MKEKDENIKAEPKSESEIKQKKFRIRDLVAYILCVVVSFGIWVYVVGLENQNYEYTFTKVEVELEGVKEMKDRYNLSLISGYDSETSITVVGSKKDIMKYTSKDISAHVNLEEVKTPDRHYIEISVDLPDGLTFVAANPSRIDIFVDKTVTKDFDIEVNLLYNIASDITMHDAIPSVEKVKVTGPETLLETISKAEVYYDVGSISTSVNFNAPIKLYDNEQNEITNPYIKMDVRDVKVTVPVTMDKTLPIVAKYTVTDGDKYDYDVKIMMDYITVVGDPKLVQSMENIEADLGDITNYSSGSISVKNGLNMPLGVDTKDSTIELIEYKVDKTIKGEK